MDKTVVEQAVREALKKVQGDHEQIKVGVSQRHIHLSREDLDTLFGKGYELTKKKTLMGREFASEECVTLVGPSLKSIERVRVLGPVRAKTQVEISRTDTFILKVSPPVRPSGRIRGFGTSCCCRPERQRLSQRGSYYCEPSYSSHPRVCKTA